MAVILIVICALALLTIFWIKHVKERRELEQHSITPETLYTLLTSNQDVPVFDVRQPLDLLSDSEIIPGAKRLSPREVVENPSLIPSERDVIVYCTCPSEKSTRAILRRALDLRFGRVKFLTGGLEAWKAKGYPVERYDKPFHLDTSTSVHP